MFSALPNHLHDAGYNTSKHNVTKELRKKANVRHREKVQRLGALVPTDTQLADIRSVADQLSVGKLRSFWDLVAGRSPADIQRLFATIRVSRPLSYRGNFTIFYTTPGFQGADRRIMVLVKGDVEMARGDTSFLMAFVLKHCRGAAALLQHYAAIDYIPPYTEDNFDVDPEAQLEEWRELRSGHRALDYWTKRAQSEFVDYDNEAYLLRTEYEEGGADIVSVLSDRALPTALYTQLAADVVLGCDPGADRLVVQAASSKVGSYVRRAEACGIPNIRAIAPLVGPHLKRHGVFRKGRPHNLYAVFSTGKEDAAQSAATILRAVRHANTVRNRAFTSGRTASDINGLARTVCESWFLEAVADQEPAFALPRGSKFYHRPRSRYDDWRAMARRPSRSAFVRCCNDESLPWRLDVAMPSCLLPRLHFVGGGGFFAEHDPRVGGPQSSFASVYRSAVHYNLVVTHVQKLGWAWRDPKP